MSAEILPDGTPIPMDLFALVKALRAKVQAEPELKHIAPDIGVTYAGLNQFKNGTRSMPTIETMQKLCDYYGIQVAVATHRTPIAQVEPQRVVIVNEGEPVATPVVTAAKGKKAA